MDATAGKRTKILTIVAVMIFAGTILIVPAVSDDSSAESIELTKYDWSGAGFSWSYKNHTLELSNFAFNDSVTPFIFPDSSPVTMVLSGVNTIEVTGTETAVGIDIEGADLQITGNGSLTIKTDGTLDSYGIICDALDIETCTRLSIESNSAVLAYGVDCSAFVTRESSDISIKSNSTAGQSYGVSAETLNMTDSDAYITSYGANSCGVDISGKITLNNTYLDVTAGRYGAYCTDNITLSNSSSFSVMTVGPLSYGVTAKKIVSNQGYLMSNGTEYAFSASESITAYDSVVINANEDCSAAIPKKLTQKSQSMSVVISNTDAPQLKMNMSTMKLRAGNSNTLSVIYKSENLEKYGVTWSSASDSIATVDQDGKVTGRGNGTVTIIATSNLDSSQTAKCVVTVGTATGTEPVDLWIPIVCAVIGCLAILGVSLFINKRLK